MDRRELLKACLLTTGAYLLHTPRLWAAPQFKTSPFTLGVASGDPSPDGVVLWTRLAPDPLNDGGMAPEPVAVHWEIAIHEAMRRLIRSGTAIALPEWAHSVHVELAGLDPDRWYWFRFRAGDLE